MPLNLRQAYEADRKKQEEGLKKAPSGRIGLRQAYEEELRRQRELQARMEAEAQKRQGYLSAPKPALKPAPAPEIPSSPVQPAPADAMRGFRQAEAQAPMPKAPMPKTTIQTPQAAPMTAPQPTGQELIRQLLEATKLAPSPAQAPADISRGFRQTEALPSIPRITPAKEQPSINMGDLTKAMAQASSPQLQAKVPESKPVDWKKTKDKTVKFVSNAARSLASGTANVQSSYLNLARLIHRGSAEIMGAIFPGYNPEEDPVVKGFDRAMEYQLSGADKLSKPLEKLEGAEKFISTGLQAVPQVVASVLTAYALMPSTMVKTAGALSPAAKTVGQAFVRNYPKIARMLPFGAQAAGGAALRAEQEGANYTQQVVAGVLTGLGEMTTEALPLEYAMRSIRYIGADNIVEAGARNLTTRYKKAGIEYLKALVAETLEEVAMEPIGESIRKATYAPETPWTGEGGVLNPKQMLEAGYGGLAMSVMLGALGLPATAKSHIMANRAIRQQNKDYDKVLQDISVQLNKDLNELETSLPESEIEAPQSLEEIKGSMQEFQRKRRAEMGLQWYPCGLLLKHWNLMLNGTKKPGQFI